MPGCTCLARTQTNANTSSMPAVSRPETYGSRVSALPAASTALTRRAEQFSGKNGRHPSAHLGVRQGQQFLPSQERELPSHERGAWQPPWPQLLQVQRPRDEAGLGHRGAEDGCQEDHRHGDVAQEELQGCQARRQAPEDGLEEGGEEGCGSGGEGVGCWFLPSRPGGARQGKVRQGEDLPEDEEVDGEVPPCPQELSSAPPRSRASMQDRR